MLSNVKDDSTRSTIARRRVQRVESAKGSLTRSDWTILALFTAVTVALSGAVLWRMGVLGSGVWVNTPESRVRFIQDGSQELARLLAGRPDKPVALVFYSESCAHCKQMRGPFLTCSREYPDVQFLAVPVDSVVNRRLAQHYKVKFVPCLFYMRSSSYPDAFVLHEGSTSLSAVRAFLDKHVTVQTEPTR